MKPLLTSNLLKVAGILSGLAICVLTGCRENREGPLMMIPATSVAVMSLDLAQMSDHIIASADLMHAISSQAAIGQSLAMLPHSGIDLHGSVYGFADPRAGVALTSGLILPLLDAQAFTDFLRNVPIQWRQSPMRKGSDDISQAEAADGSLQVIWDSRAALLLYQLDVIGGISRALVDPRDLFQTGARSPLAADNVAFQNLLKAEHDLSVFLNYEQIAPIMTILHPLAARSGIREGTIGMGLNLHQQSVTLDLTAQYDEAAAAYLDLLRKDLDPALTADLSSELPVACFSLAVSPEKLLPFLTDWKVMEDLERDMAEDGGSLQRLLGSMTGDVVVACQAEGLVEASWPISDSLLPFTLAIGLRDSGELASILERMVQGGGLLQDGQRYSAPEGGAVLLLEQNRLLISDPEMSHRIMSGDAKDLPRYQQEMVQHYGSAFALDLLPLSPILEKRMSSEFSAEIARWATEHVPILGIEAYLEEPSAGAIQGRLRIRTRSDQSDGLATIMEYVETLFLLLRDQPSPPGSLSNAYYQVPLNHEGF